MSRQAPLVTKKEIIYRRSYIDDHNDRFDNVMKNPTSHSSHRKTERERPQNVVVSHNYHSDVESEYQLSKINKKLDHIISILRSPTSKKTADEHFDVDTRRQEQTQQYKEICARLEKLEAEITGKTLASVPLYGELSELTNKVHQLARIQEDLRESLSAGNVAGEDIDELLKVINETRRDMEEKIGNIKQLSDGNYIHLEDKLDGYLRNQHGIQLQVDHLMHLLTTSSRPVSATEKSVSRSSSKSSSLKPTLVIPTSRSPPPKTPSENSYTSTHPKSERSGTHKTPSTITSSSSIPSVISSKKTTQLVSPQVAPKKPVRSMTYEVLEKTKSIETLNEMHIAQKRDPSVKSSSSGSFIAPLAIDERRNSQPANIFLTKKY